MKKTVEKEIKRIAKYVEKETGSDITDYLYDAAENYEYDDDGEKATCQWTINGLWFEADKFIELKKEENR